MSPGAAQMKVAYEAPYDAYSLPDVDISSAAAPGRARRRSRKASPDQKRAHGKPTHDVVTHRRSPLLDVALHRAGREHRAHARRQLPDLAAAAIRRGRQYGWQGLLSISELLPLYNEKHEEFEPDEVMEFMVKDESNPRRSSPACGPRARTRARCAARSPPKPGRRRTRPGSKSTACCGRAISSATRRSSSNGSSSARTCRAA